MLYLDSMASHEEMDRFRLSHPLANLDIKKDPLPPEWANSTDTLAAITRFICRHLDNTCSTSEAVNRQNWIPELSNLIPEFFKNPAPWVEITEPTIESLQRAIITQLRGFCISGSAADECGYNSCPHYWQAKRLAAVSFVLKIFEPTHGSLEEQCDALMQIACV